MTSKPKFRTALILLLSMLAGGIVATGAIGEESAESGTVFKPTEEISEDYAVAFPVDI